MTVVAASASPIYIQELIDLGYTPMVDVPGAGYAVFITGQSAVMIGDGDTGVMSVSSEDYTDLLTKMRPEGVDQTTADAVLKANPDIVAQHRINPLHVIAVEADMIDRTTGKLRFPNPKKVAADSIVAGEVAARETEL